MDELNTKDVHVSFKDKEGNILSYHVFRISCRNGDK